MFVWSTEIVYVRLEKLQRHFGEGLGEGKTYWINWMVVS